MDVGKLKKDKAKEIISKVLKNEKLFKTLIKIIANCYDVNISTRDLTRDD